jgi:hypothetical protein
MPTGCAEVQHVNSGASFVLQRVCSSACVRQLGRPACVWGLVLGIHSVLHASAILSFADWEMLTGPVHCNKSGLCACLCAAAAA